MDRSRDPARLAAGRIRTTAGAPIRADPADTDRQADQAWRAAGNATAGPDNPAPREPPPAKTA